MENTKNNEAVKNAQREYYKKWRAANKDKVRQYNQNYWKKRALEAGTSEADEIGNAEENV